MSEPVVENVGVILEVPPHNRPCHGCGQEDDHPRFQWWDGQTELLFHHDCVPAYIKDQDGVESPAFKACADGLRGDDVRQVVVKHAQREARQAAKEAKEAQA